MHDAVRYAISTLFHRRIDGFDVWVSIRRPLIVKEATGAPALADHLVAAFSVGPHPVVADAEYVVDVEGRPVQFPTEQEGVRAALEQALRHGRRDAYRRDLTNWLDPEFRGGIHVD